MLFTLTQVFADVDYRELAKKHGLLIYSISNITSVYLSRFLIVEIFNLFAFVYKVLNQCILEKVHRTIVKPCIGQYFGISVLCHQKIWEHLDPSNIKKKIQLG